LHLVSQKLGSVWTISDAKHPVFLIRFGAEASSRYGFGSTKIMRTIFFGIFLKQVPYACITIFKKPSHYLLSVLLFQRHFSLSEFLLYSVLYENVLSKCPVYQCCGSGRFLTGSGSDFWKRPDPHLTKFLAKFLQNYFVGRKYSML
jgi:hypothetical protein